PVEHEHHGEDHYRQKEIGERARCHYGRALTQGLEKEAVAALGRGPAGARGLIGYASGVLVSEELDVAAERDRGDLPARAMTVVEAEKLRPEADREHQHPDAAPACNQEMAELVEEYDNRKQKQERNDPSGPPSAPQVQVAENF